MQERAPLLAPGERVGQRFRVVAPVREGGMAEIYEAVDEQSGRRVALKVLKSESTVDHGALTRFERELNVLLGLSHPNLVRAYGRGRSKSGHLLIILEWLTGCDLADVLELERRVDPVKACRIARGIARGLGALHAAGVVHRDIKPENVYLAQNGRDPDSIRILDLGFAKLLGSSSRALTADGTLVGTVAYMAPEQTRADVDGRVDLYALGVVLFECLIGKVPFDSESPRQRILRLATAKTGPKMAEIAPSLPKPIAPVLERCLEPDRDRRYQTAQELEHAIEVAERLM